MNREVRTVKYDLELNIEAYHFEGIMQKFPNHFHDYYVIGFIESGKRRLSCKDGEYIIEPGDLLLLNPGDHHTCEQCDGKALDYRCINIRKETMNNAVLEITGEAYPPCFTRQVVFHSELVPLLKELQLMIMQGEEDFKKEETFFFLLEQLIEQHTQQGILLTDPVQSAEIKAVCEFLEQNYMGSITLEELSRRAGLSKYYFLRLFTKQQGISPYSYLEAIRIEKAKKLLEQGVLPVDAALQTGFSDQSHFSNFFKRFIGLTPRQYMRIFKDLDN